ncbi:MAG: TlpA family protein disulfide reductase [Planctomycetes bacterium]|nr:TlpA family protein disulfide reductase [Planctomycetota bacterium]
MSGQPSQAEVESSPSESAPSESAPSGASPVDATPEPSPAPRPGLPWGILSLLVVALIVLWSATPGVPVEAPLGETPPPVSVIQAWIVPDGASAAPTHSGSLDFKALEGRAVLLEFYATWCAPCQASLVALNEREPDPRLVVIALTAVDRRQSAADVRAFALQQRFPTALVSADVIKAYGVRQIPYAVLVGREGRVVWKGSPLDSSYAEALQAALGPR